MISIISTESLEDDTRHMAVEFMIVLCERAPGMMRKQGGYVSQLFQLALRMSTDVSLDTPEELVKWASFLRSRDFMHSHLHSLALPRVKTKTRTRKTRPLRMRTSVRKHSTVFPSLSVRPFLVD